MKWAVARPGGNPAPLQKYLCKMRGPTKNAPAHRRSRLTDAGRLPRRSDKLHQTNLYT